MRPYLVVADPRDERIDAASFGEGVDAAEAMEFFKRRGWFRPDKKKSKRFAPPVFFVVYGNQVLGMVALTSRKVPFGTDGAVVRMLSVEVMGVESRWQGRSLPSGDGRTAAMAVMDLLKEHAAAKGLAGVSLRVRPTNRRARAFYRKCGFRMAAAPVLGDDGHLLRLAWWCDAGMKPTVDIQPKPSI